MHVKKNSHVLHACVEGGVVKKKNSHVLSGAKFFFVVKNLWLKTGAIVLLKFYELLTI
jgi:hypothetical protein